MGFYSMFRYHLHSRLMFVLGCLFSCLAMPAWAADSDYVGSSEGHDFIVEPVAKGLGVVWGMAFLDAHQILFTERAGKVKLLDTVSGDIQPVTGAPSVWAEGQGGLLDVAPVPDYKSGDWIYFTYSKAQDRKAVTALARAKLDNRRLVNWQDLVLTRSATDTGRHFGSRVAFDGQGHVFFSVGDRGVRPNGQDLATHAGKILRVNLDGSVPTDNPFANNPKALPEIWSYGHRNPQGLVYDRQLQRLWAMEHGPRGGDELNLIEPGRNYGWAVISYGQEYYAPIQVGIGTHKEGMEQPRKVYIPSIAPGSLLLYRGKAFPHWQGDLLAGALKLLHLNRIDLNAAGEPAGEERLLQTLDERIRALAESPEGWLYISADSGKILRLRPR